MAPLEKIKDFLLHVSDISLGYNEINFIKPNSLDEGQIGFSINAIGKSLITGNQGDWQKEWLVIATDELGDPVLVDLNSVQLTVLSAAHGEGNWEPFVIADSLGDFGKIIMILKGMSQNRTSPVELQNNPITDEERQIAISKIQMQNPNAEIWFWERYFENT